MAHKHNKFSFHLCHLSPWRHVSEENTPKGLWRPWARASLTHLVLCCCPRKGPSTAALPRSWSFFRISLGKSTAKSTEGWLSVQLTLRERKQEDNCHGLLWPFRISCSATRNRALPASLPHASCHSVWLPWAKQNLTLSWSQDTFPTREHPHSPFPASDENRCDSQQVSCSESAAATPGQCEAVRRWHS